MGLATQQYNPTQMDKVTLNPKPNKVETVATLGPGRLTLYGKDVHNMYENVDLIVTSNHRLVVKPRFCSKSGKTKLSDEFFWMEFDPKNIFPKFTKKDDIRVQWTSFLLKNYFEFECSDQYIDNYIHFKRWVIQASHLSEEQQTEQEMYYNRVNALGNVFSDHSVNFGFTDKTLFRSGLVALTELGSQRWMEVHGEKGAIFGAQICDLKDVQWDALNWKFKCNGASFCVKFSSKGSYKLFQKRLDELQEVRDVKDVKVNEVPLKIEVESVPHEVELVPHEVELVEADKDQEAWAKPIHSCPNSNLEVGQAMAKSFVVHGNSISVFDTSKDLTYMCDIQLATKLCPSKVMLHKEDRAMVMRTDKALMTLDLETEKVVDEWHCGKIADFAPLRKHSNTQEPTFLAVDKKSVYLVDPRVKGGFVRNKSKTYGCNQQFSAITSSMDGEFLTGSSKGILRVHDTPGKNAKFVLGNLGLPINYIDISNDRYVLVTLPNCLLVWPPVAWRSIHGNLETRVGPLRLDSANEGRPLGKGENAHIQLALRPDHAKYIKHELGTVNFTAARFDCAEDHGPRRIMTSVGNYVVSWDLKQVLEGNTEYTIKRYEQKVVASDFKYGSNDWGIVTLGNAVGMVPVKNFEKPRFECPV